MVDGTWAHATDAMLIPSYCLLEPCLPSTSRSVCQALCTTRQAGVCVTHTATACVAGTIYTAYTDRQTDRQADRQAGKQTDRQAVGQTGRQTHRQAEEKCAHVYILPLYVKTYLLTNSYLRNMVVTSCFVSGTYSTWLTSAIVTRQQNTCGNFTGVGNTNWTLDQRPLSMLDSFDSICNICKSKSCICPSVQ